MFRIAKSEREFQGYKELYDLLTLIINENIRNNMRISDWDDLKKTNTELDNLKLSTKEDIIKNSLPKEIINELPMWFLVKKGDKLINLLNAEEPKTPDLLGEYLLYCFLNKIPKRKEIIYSDKEKIEKLRIMLTEYMIDEIYYGKEIWMANLEKTVNEYIDNVISIKKMIDCDVDELSSLLFWDYDFLLLEEFGVRKILENKELLEILGYIETDIIDF